MTTTAEELFAMETPFHQLKPAERASLAASHPKVYRDARRAWAEQIANTQAKRVAALKAADRAKLSAELVELTQHGFPSSAA